MRVVFSYSYESREVAPGSFPRSDLFVVVVSLIFLEVQIQFSPCPVSVSVVVLPQARDQGGASEGVSDHSTSRLTGLMTSRSSQQTT